MFFQKYIFGDTAVYYAESPIEGHEGKTTVGLAMYPADVPVDAQKLHCDGMVQVAFTGDEGLIDYTFGVTMRNRAATVLHVEKQTADERGVVTVLSDGKGNSYTHILEYDAETGVFALSVCYENGTGAERTLEMLESFSISGIGAPSDGLNSTCGLTLHRMTSAWSRECRPKADTFAQLGLDMSWGRYGVKCEKWGQVGSMPDRGWYPFAAVEDSSAGVVWAVQIEAPYSWQLEVYKEKETCALSGGMGDYEFAHWRKKVPAGATFTTDKAYLRVMRGSVLQAENALVRAADRRLNVPVSEEELPVLFNEYCTTWGVPSEENIRAILAAIRPLGLKYFVIDCGWYKPDDRGWCNAIGDWKESGTLFPHGVKAVADAIRAEGLRPGIWFEFEVAGRDSDAFHNEEMLLKRDGATITSKNRRFFDLRSPAVNDYISARMTDFLAKNGFGYIKIDYNDTYGVGCDGAESLGEGGRQVAEESLAWLTKIKRAVPDMVIENCSSGGSRIEPKRMNMVSMCSFSDAHECAEIPLVAANVSRVIPARQSQIWAVLREKDTPSRTIYSLCAAMLGRICLSGDVLNMSAEKIELIRAGLAFYERVKPIVREGEITCIDCDVEYYRAPKGRQIYIKELGDQKLVIVHRLEGRGGIEIPAQGYALKEAYTDLKYTFGDTLRIADTGEYMAGAFLLEKRA